MSNRHDMNSAGGAELLALRREPATEKMVPEGLWQDERATCERLFREREVLSKRLALQEDLNMRLAAHIIDLNGKIVDLEKTLAYEQGVIARQEAIVLDLQSKLKASADLSERAGSAYREAAAEIGPIGGCARPGTVMRITATQLVHVNGVDLAAGESLTVPAVRMRPQPQRRAHRMGLDDDQCQDCGIIGYDIVMNMIVLGHDECKGKPDGA